MLAIKRDVVVVGGGQAGLAIGYHLARQGRDFTILDAADAPAAAWRNRWDSLRLFTPVRFDSLPGLAFPGDPDSYPGRDDVAGYLTDYAQRFDLPVELRSRVRALTRADDRYLLELDDGRSYDAAQVVVATGPFQVPRVPEVARQLHGDVFQIHSSDYRNPGALPPGPVLVVGGGNTGFQIAAELSATHEVELSIGSRQAPLPQRILGRDVFTFLELLGAMTKSVDTRIGRRMNGAETLTGSSPRKLRRRHGVPMRPRAVAAEGASVRFEDGSSMTASSVVWATGFGIDHSWIDVPVLDEAGRAVHRRGVTDSRGLYFIGLPWLHSRGSALLGWVKHDAQYLADRIGALPATAPAGTPLAPSTTERTHA